MDYIILDESSPLPSNWQEVARSMRHRPIQICDTCGCPHRAFIAHQCNSCSDATHRVNMERFINAMARTVSESCGVPLGMMLAPMPGMMSQHMARALRPRVVVHPANTEVTRVLERAGISVESGVQYGHSILPDLIKAGIQCGNTERRYSEIANMLRRYGMTPPQPRPTTNRNKGPRPHGKWWLK